MTHDPIIACAQAIITLGRAFHPELDEDRDDYARKCGKAAQTIFAASAADLNQATERLIDNGEARFVNDAKAILANVIAKAKAMGPEPWGWA